LNSFFNIFSIFVLVTSVFKADLIPASGFFGDKAINSSPLAFSIPDDHLYHVFITHDWGTDTLGRNNHDTMKLVNAALKRRGLVTWFDGDKLEDNISQQVPGGIQGAGCVLCAITRRYLQKVDGANSNDNCKLEFGYSTDSKSSDQIIAVSMEPQVLDPKSWTGPIGLYLGSHTYLFDLVFEISSDMARFEAVVDKIVERIRVICSRL
jgi:hypothetical protein